jgi:mannose-6-phosphate isomerase-like protein (cupin superfamily)
MRITNRRFIQPFTGEDGSIIRELARLARHTLAEIRHPAGTASREHYHTQAEEVYYVLDGHGEVRIDGETQPIGPGDLVEIVAGQRHKLWQRGESDLILLVTCAPPYDEGEVVFTE